MPIAAATGAAAYQAISNLAPNAATGAGTASQAPASFGDFLSDAMHNAVQTMQAGEQMATKQVAGQANIVDVVNAVNQAEITLDTVVAVRDKVISAYQSIMQMPM